MASPLTTLELSGSSEGVNVISSTNPFGVNIPIGEITLSIGEHPPINLLTEIERLATLILYATANKGEAYLGKWELSKTESDKLALGGQYANGKKLFSIELSIATLTDPSIISR